MSQQDQPEPGIDEITRRAFMVGGAAAAVGAAAAARITGAQAGLLDKMTPASPSGATLSDVQDGGAGAVTIASLTADCSTDPLGVDVATPRLAWVLQSDERNEIQTAYQVIVATNPGALAAGQGDVWDSGMVKSAESTGTDYGGPALQSAARYYWKVRVWDRQGLPSPWSATAWWEMGLLDDAAWSGAQWIGGSATNSAWPDGTIATASSTYPPQGGVTYYPQNAIDGNPSTFWNDDTPDAYPDWLTITSPTPVTMPGVTITSVSVPPNAAGQPPVAAPIEDFTVATWDGTSWVQQASVTGNTDVTLEVPFPSAVSTTSVRITVTLAPPQAAPFSRIAEVVPLLQQSPPGTSGTLPSLPEPLLRKNFSITKQVASARAYISGLGYYVLSIDGHRIGDRVLDPGFTVYNDRALYSTYDVTSPVRTLGRHTVGVALGRGFFGLYPQDTSYWGTAPWLANPEFRLKLAVTYTDGTSTTITSDGTWQIHAGPTVSDSVYMGEIYDARNALPGWNTPLYDASAWSQATVRSAPASNLSSERMAPIRVVDSMRAEQITNPKPGTYVFKFPVMTAGWAQLRVTGEAGTKVTLRYGETLNADGTVNNAGDPGITNGPIQTDTYILSGEGVETWQPQFSYKGFQYVEVDGYPGTPAVSDVTAQVVHTDLPSAGNFTSSDNMLNTIHTMARRTILNNMHSIMTDTPMFEKRGWLDDVIELAPTTDDNFAMQLFYRNWLTSMQEDQGPSGNGVQLAPNNAPAGTSDVTPTWGGALVILPWQMYQDYGDIDVLASSYGSMKSYVDYVAAGASNFIQPGFYGDWTPPGSAYPPEGPQLVDTAYSYLETQILAKAAAVLGYSTDAAHYEQLSSQIQSAFNATFLDSVAGVYHTDIDAGYRQVSNVLPLVFGLVPDNLVTTVAQNLDANVKALGYHLNTGEVGTKLLLPALTTQGYVDSAYNVATQQTYPSWGYWISNGATTMWESWELTTRSRDHAFKGTIDDWFYRYLVGIQPAAPGYAEITFRPYVPADLGHAAASQETVRGLVASSWTKNGNAFELDVTVPVNAIATVYVPLFGNDNVHATNGAKLLRIEDGAAVYPVGSGRWQFISQLS